MPKPLYIGLQKKTEPFLTRAMNVNQDNRPFLLLLHSQIYLFPIREAGHFRWVFKLNAKRVQHHGE